jgi:uncharacterized SAM-binding protein YcdF (DUF218 family)
MTESRQNFLHGGRNPGATVRLTQQNSHATMPSMLGCLIATILPYPRLRRVQVWIAVFASFVFLVLLAFFNVGHWLVHEDPLQKAAAIVVLSGRMPERALEAARIYKQGYAPRLWLTYSTEPSATLQKLSVPFTGEESYNKQLLIHEGVPESVIQVLDPPILNTADEMRAIAAMLQYQQQHTVILVTSKVHTRRVKTLWNRLSGKSGTAIVRGVSDDVYDPAHWWRNTGDALDVVREVLGLLNAWAGLPLHPST